MEHFSHREAFHRHLANIYNEKEKRNLKSVTKFYEKCRDEQQYCHSLEEKELRRHLVDLKRERKHWERDGSCLDLKPSEVQENDVMTHMTAHDVAKHMVNRQSSGPRIKRKRNETPHEIPPTTSTGPNHHSWHDNKLVSDVDDQDSSIRLPTIKPSDHTKRRSSIGDPQEISHVIHRRLAWGEKCHSPEEGKKMVKQTSSKTSYKPSTHGVSDFNHSSASRIAGKTNSSRGSMGQGTRKSSKSKKQGHTEITPTSSKQDIYIPSGNHSDGQYRCHRIDPTSLQHYYDVLAENGRNLKEQDNDFVTPTDSYGPIGTLKRSNRRKMMALEALLMKLPSFKDKEQQMDPLQCLNCSYLRLSKQNIEDLEEECLSAGKDPGVHAHMTNDRVHDYYLQGS